MNPKKYKHYLSFTFFCLLFSTELRPSGEKFSASNWAEIGLAVAKGPLAALSYKYKDQYDKKARAIQVTTDLTRIACKILSVINHPPHEVGISGSFWLGFDACNTILDLYKDEEAAEYDQLISVSNEHIEQVNTTIKNIQLYLLPLLEAGAATLGATFIEDTPLGHLRLRQAQSVESLSRAISIYLNHQNSKPALVLLLAAIGEAGYTLNLTLKINNPKNTVNPNEPDLDEPNPSGDDDFDPDYWNNPERERELERMQQARAADQRRQEHQRLELQRRAMILPELRRENGELFVYRSGQRMADEGIQDPINLEEFEAGAQVRIFACNHALRQEDVPMIQNQNQCPACQQPRIHGREHVLVVPAQPGNIANID